MITRRRLGAGLLLALLVAAGCSSSSDPATDSPPTPTRPSASPGCEEDEVAQPGISDRTMTSRGVERVFQLHLPERYDGVTPMPIVLNLHALTVSYAIVPSLSGFPDAAQAHDFVLVSPSGLIDGSTPYWHAFPAPDDYDVAFIADLLDLLESELCVDPSRVFSTGMSNGAQMSSLLACRLSERITAVAPIAGVEFYEECEGEPVPVVAFHGTDDPIVTYEGGGLNAMTISNAHYWKGQVPADLPQHLGVDGAMRHWADHNGCEPEPVEEQVSPEVRKRVWPGCAAETILYIIDGGGHTYPGWPVPGFDGFGHTTTDIDATQLLFELFLDPPQSSA